MNRSSRDGAWLEGGGALPDADELAAYLAAEFHYEEPSPDLAEVSQYVWAIGENDLYDALHRVFGGSYSPTGIHRFVAELPKIVASTAGSERYQVVVTTNYDDALEQAFREAGEPYDLAIYLADGRARGKFIHLPWDAEFVQRKDCPDWSDRQPITVDDPNNYKSFPIDVESRVVHRTIIVKIHGAVAKYGDLNDVVGDQNFVITENDYIDYLSRSPIVGLVPNQLLNQMVRGHMLFLGQRVRDWSWRVFLQRVWDDRIRDSWAVTPDLDEFERRFWRKLGVEAIDRSLTTYVDELRAQLLAADLSEAR